MKNKREELAALCHEQWSGWMHYLFSKCEISPHDGSADIYKSEGYRIFSLRGIRENWI